MKYILKKNVITLGHFDSDWDREEDIGNSGPGPSLKAPPRHSQSWDNYI